MEADELELWSRCTEVDARNALYERYADQINRVIEKIIWNMGLPPNVDQDALHTAGAIGALDAITKFDPARQLKFMTFAPWRIRGAILDELRRSDISRSVRAIVTTRLNAEQELLQSLGRDPTVDEVCEHLGWTTREYLFSTARAQVTLNAHKLRRAGYWIERPQTLLDLKETPIGSDAESVFREMTRGLSIEEQTLVYLYYWCGATMKLTGQAMGLSESRVSQIHTALTKRLKLAGSEQFAGLIA